jgi:hypothetical protein
MIVPVPADSRCGALRIDADSLVRGRLLLAAYPVPYLSRPAADQVFPLFLLTGLLYPYGSGRSTGVSRWRVSCFRAPFFEHGNMIAIVTAAPRYRMVKMHAPAWTFRVKLRGIGAQFALAAGCATIC